MYRRAVTGVVLLGVGCGGVDATSPGAPGHLALTVQVSAVLPVERISYAIEHRRGGLSLSGAIPIDDLTRTIRANVRGLPPAKGYRVTLTAASADGDLSCTGAADFDVVAGQTTALSAGLDCTSRSGAAGAGTSRSYCPIVQSSSVAPTQTAVGGSVTVSVSAAAPAGEGPMTYSWTGTGGTFASPGAPSTAFKCEAEGIHVLTLRVAAGRCADRATVTVHCVALACGNGRVEPGESCDDGNRNDGDACPADCVRPGCGNGRLEPEETCEPPGTATCDGRCRALSGCGNGLVEAPEQCDDANRVPGDGCSIACTLEAICGDGVVEAGEACEPPGVGRCTLDCRQGPAR